MPGPADVLARLCRKYFVDECAVDEADRFELVAALQTATRDEATRLYTLFCAMAADTPARVAALLAALPPSERSLAAALPLTEPAIRDFVNVFLVVGSLVDYCADAIELSPDERLAKWNAEASEWNERRRAQLETLKHQEARSLFRVEGKRLNRAAYDTVRANLREAPTEPWEQLVQLDVSELKKKPPSFWTGMRFERLTDGQVRALLHKAKLYADEHGSLPPSLVAQLGLAEERLFVRARRDKRSARPFLCACRRRRRR